MQMQQNFVSHPFTCQIRKVSNTGRSSHNDKTTREWYDYKANKIRHEKVADYALADVHQTVVQYKEYIRVSVLGNNPSRQSAIVKVVEGFREPEYGAAIVGDVFQKAWDYFCCLPSANEKWDFFYQPWPPEGTPGKKAEKKAEMCRSVSEKEFLLGWFELRFALSKLLIPNRLPLSICPGIMGISD